MQADIKLIGVREKICVAVQASDTIGTLKETLRCHLRQGDALEKLRAKYGAAPFIELAKEGEYLQDSTTIQACASSEGVTFLGFLLKQPEEETISQTGEGTLIADLSDIDAEDTQLPRLVNMSLLELPIASRKSKQEINHDASDDDLCSTCPSIVDVEEYRGSATPESYWVYDYPQFRTPMDEVPVSMADGNTYQNASMSMPWALGTSHPTIFPYGASHYPANRGYACIPITVATAVNACFPNYQQLALCVAPTLPLENNLCEDDISQLHGALAGNVSNSPMLPMFQQEMQNHRGDSEMVQG
jgi:hypothetical protein